MSEVVELHPSDIDASFASAWDALPPARGAQADIYDSHAWFAAWLSAAPKRAVDRVRIVAVMDGGLPVAILPLLRLSGSRAAIIGMDRRTRARPIVGTELPSAEVIGHLAEGVAQSGLRDLNLHRMPSHDPVTEHFVDALTSAGYDVSQFERSCDNLAATEGGWDEYAQTLKGFARYARRFMNRLESLWSVEFDTYGTSPESPVTQGFEIYRELHRQSWKGARGATGGTLREKLLRHAEEKGWARVYVLRVGGVPAAAHIWFRLGSVATWLSTAHDQRLAALSPGTVMMWQAQASIFADRPPHLVDLLPGANPQKDRLTTSRPPLLVTEAVRPSMWSGAVVPTRRRVRRVVAAAEARVRRRRRGQVALPLLAGKLTATVGPRLEEAEASPVEVTAAHRRYIATAVAHPTPEKMAAQWGDADEWWTAGDGPGALIRIDRESGSGVAGREIVRLDPACDPVSCVAAVASALGREVILQEAPIHDAVLPWPGSWHVQVGGKR